MTLQKDGGNSLYGLPLRTKLIVMLSVMSAGMMAVGLVITLFLPRKTLPHHQ